MVTMTLTDLYDNSVWGPDLIRGGTVSNRSGTQMTYLSEDGYTVTFNGSGFTYDDDGNANDGVVTSMVVKLGGQLVFSFTGMTDSFPRLASFALGDSQDGPDPDRLFQTVLRGDDIINGSAGGNDVVANLGGGLAQRRQDHCLNNIETHRLLEQLDAAIEHYPNPHFLQRLQSLWGNGGSQHCLAIQFAQLIALQLMIGRNNDIGIPHRLLKQKLIEQPSGC